MRRLFAAIIDVIICFILVVIWRFGLAVIQRTINELNNTYRSIAFYNTDGIIELSFLPVILLYYLFFGRKNKMSIGKRIMGIRVMERSGRAWKVLHMFLRIIGIMAGPLAILYYLVIGGMPYDRLLRIEVTDKSNIPYRKRGGIIRFYLLVYILWISDFAYRYNDNVRRIIYQIFTLISGYMWVLGCIAAIYIATLNLPIEYIGEAEIEQGEGGEACEYIFSEEGEEKAWGIVINKEEDYMEECVKNGYGIEELEGFEFHLNKDFLVCTYGRKLTDVKILPGLLDGETPPLLVLDSEYERGRVYYYRVTNVWVEYPYEFYHREGEAYPMVVSTNYQKLREGKFIYPLIEIKEPIGRWAWSFRYKMKERYPEIYQDK